MSRKTNLKGINIVVLNENNMYSNGLFYGEALKEELLGAREHLIDSFGKHGASYNDLRRTAKVFFFRYSREYKPFLYGMAEGAEMSFDDVNIVNGMETLLTLLPTSDTSDQLVHCSYLTIPPTESATGSTIIGRNYDFSPEIYKDIAKNLTLTVFNNPGKMPTATIGMPGQIYCPTCINQNGLLLELNNGMPSGGYYINKTRESLLTNMLKVMQGSESLDDINSKMMSLESDYSLIINAANQSHTFSYEYSSLSLIGMKPYSPKSDEYFVSTNFYLNGSWGLPEPKDALTWHGVTRRDNLIKLLDEGECFDLKGTKHLMDKTTEQGGAAWEMTLYQMIFQPELNELSLKIAGENWVDIQMEEFYESRYICGTTEQICE